MNEDRHSPPGREEEQKQCVERYELMVRDGQRSYFDVEEFSLIIGHYLDANDVKRAREVLDFAYAQHPGSVDLRFWEAQVMINTGKLNKALEILDGLQKLEPFDPDIHLHKAGIYSQCATTTGPSSTIAGRWTWPRRIWTASTSTSPSSTRTWRTSIRRSNA
jgi:hypothetical protein